MEKKTRTTTATDMRQNRWLFISFPKELNLGLPKLLSLTDLYKNFVMRPTVQELLLDIVVYVSFVNSKQYFNQQRLPITWPVSPLELS